jgi:hypothetical protein
MGRKVTGLASVLAVLFASSAAFAGDAPSVALRADATSVLAAVMGDKTATGSAVNWGTSVAIRMKGNFDAWGEVDVTLRSVVGGSNAGSVGVAGAYGTLAAPLVYGARTNLGGGTAIEVALTEAYYKKTWDELFGNKNVTLTLVSGLQDERRLFDTNSVLGGYGETGFMYGALNNTPCAPILYSAWGVAAQSTIQVGSAVKLGVVIGLFDHDPDRGNLSVGGLPSDGFNVLDGTMLGVGASAEYKVGANLDGKAGLDFLYPSNAPVGTETPWALVINATQGVYAVDTKKIAVGARFAFANDKAMTPKLQASAGATAQGLMANRPNDVIGLAFSACQGSDKVSLNSSTEFAIEGYYKAELAKGLALTPDLIFVSKPGGSSLNSLVAIGARIQAIF